jgi:hypothetical protein
MPFGTDDRFDIGPATAARWSMWLITMRARWMRPTFGSERRAEHGSADCR